MVDPFTSSGTSAAKELASTQPLNCLIFTYHSPLIVPFDFALSTVSVNIFLCVLSSVLSSHPFVAASALRFIISEPSAF